QLLPRGGTQRENALFFKTIVSMRRNDEEEAHRRFESAWAEFGHVDPRQFVYLLPRFGRERELRALMTDWDSAPGSATAVLHAQAHRGLGEYDEAMKWLRRAVDERDLSVLETIRLPNANRELRDRPDYAELLRYLDSIEVSH